MSETATETTEAPEYNVRQNRKYAAHKLHKANRHLVGQAGLTKAEKVEQLKAAQEQVAKAAAALELAVAQAEAEADDEAQAEEYQTTN